MYTCIRLIKISARLLGRINMRFCKLGKNLGFINNDFYIRKRTMASRNNMDGQRGVGGWGGNFDIKLSVRLRVFPHNCTWKFST